MTDKETSVPRPRKRKLDGYYEAEDLVSVWIGNFPSREAFGDYFAEVWSEETERTRCPFWGDLGIDWHDHDFQEAIYRNRPQRLETLIEGVSWVDTFREPLLQRCHEQGIEVANSAIFYFEYDYPPEVGFSSPHLQFVGSFPYSTGGHPFRR